MFKRILSAALLLLVCLGAEAQQKREYELRRHEVSFSGGFFPARGMIGGYDYNFSSANGLYYQNSLNETYFDASSYEIEKQLPYMALNYYYNFNKYLALGASLSYEGGSKAFYYHKDDSLINKEVKNVLTTMVYLRSSWFNRKYVRMYSLIGLGASYSMEGDYDYGYEHFAIQFSPLCISVGKDIFGYIESGIGTGYFGYNFGIGYRF